MKTVGLVSEHHVDESGANPWYYMGVELADAPTLMDGETLTISWKGPAEEGRCVDVEWAVEPQEPQP